MVKEIWFDMDGTIANLYGVEGWLDMLIAKDATPYKVAAPMMRMATLARMLNKLQRKGYKIGVISWLSKNSTPEYDEAVTEAKKVWLGKHLKSVKFDRIDIVKYGTPKQKGRNGILFDDEKPNRETWKGVAYNVDNIIEVLKGLAQPLLFNAPGADSGELVRPRYYTTLGTDLSIGNSYKYFL